MRLFRLAFICLGISSSLLFAGVSNISVPSQKIHWVNSLGNNYSPYDKKGYYHKAVIEINVPISLQGEYYLGFTLTNNEISRFAKHTIQNDAISFFISAKTNTNQYVLDWPMISSIKNVIPFKFSGNNLPVYRFPIYIWLNPGQNVAPGLYQKNLELNIYQGPFGETSNFTPVASGSVLFNVEVLNQVEVSIGTDNVDTFTDFNVRFEELKEGAQVNYDAFVHSISSYYLHVKSLNKGNLTHHLDEVNTSIPYTIYLDDQLVQFNEQGEFRAFVEKESGDIKSQHKLVMILGDANHAFMGDYSDRVSIKATTE